ncbi:MAG: hypothetical protein GWP14_03925 [Actinobacteria bacterium]|nr:hypothetical protein [Actinomycetota bacterium]
MKKIWQVFICLCVVTPAYSATIYGTVAPMTGSRTVGVPGLATAEADWQDVVIDWAVVDNGNDTYTYTYTFKNFDQPGISHVTLDLSDDATDGAEDDEFADPNSVTHFLFNGNPSDELEPGDKDGITGSVKFDIGADGDLTYSFISNRLPVFGDVFVKGGHSELTNTGFSDHASLTRTALDFIARPNGLIPEPATLLLIVPGLLLLARRSGVRK